MSLVGTLLGAIQDVYFGVALWFFSPLNQWNDTLSLARTSFFLIYGFKNFIWEVFVRLHEIGEGAENQLVSSIRWTRLSCSQVLETPFTYALWVTSSSTAFQSQYVASWPNLSQEWVRGRLLEANRWTVPFYPTWKSGAAMMSRAQGFLNSDHPAS